VNHRHLLFLRVAEGKKAAGFALNGTLQVVIHAMVNEVKKPISRALVRSCSRKHPVQRD
jgi:hypothetical protein